MISVNNFELVSNKISIVTFNIMTMMSVKNIFQMLVIILLLLRPSFGMHLRF